MEEAGTWYLLGVQIKNIIFKKILFFSESLLLLGFVFLFYCTLIF